MITTQWSSDGAHVTIKLVCDSCDGGIFTVATVHLRSFARVLPSICHAAGIDLDDGSSDPAKIFNLSNPTDRAAADAHFREFVERRNVSEGAEGN